MVNDSVSHEAYSRQASKITNNNSVNGKSILFSNISNMYFIYLMQNEKARWHHAA